MKLNILFQQGFILFSSLMLVTACDTDGSSGLDNGAAVKRSDDHVNLAYTATPGTFTVCTKGAWSIQTDAAWFTVSPSEGTGDGTTREVVSVTPTQNTGAARTDSLYLIAANKHLGIGVNQAEGYISVGTPSFVGALMVGKASTAYISIPYVKGVSGQSYTATATMTGATGGITLANYTYTCATEGTIQFPITGTPTTTGSITFTVSTGLPGVSAVTVTTEITDGIILKQDFNKFLYGGDDAQYLAGTMPSSYLYHGDNNTDKDFDYTSALKTVTAQADGSNQIFATMGATYRASRNFTGWSGSQNFERPGYIKTGTASAPGYVTTPAFTAISGTSDMVITFKVMAWDQNSIETPLVFSVAGGGTCDITSYDIPARTAGTAGTWYDVTVNVSNATSASTFTISSTTTTGATRFLLDDMVVKLK